MTSVQLILGAIALPVVTCGSSDRGSPAGARSDAGPDGGRADGGTGRLDGGQPEAGGCLTLTFAIDSVPLGDSVWTLAAGDLDGDGNLDVIATTSSTVGATFLRGDGKGHLTAAGTLDGLGSSRLPVMADVDGDGRLDVVAPQPAPATAGAPAGVGVFLNSGGGTLAAPIVSLSSTTISAIALARIDADSHPDLVFTDTQTHLYVAAGNGDGTFGAPVDLGAVGGQSMFSAFPPFVGLTAVDLNGDGRDDLVAGMGSYDLLGGGPNAGVGIWLNNGTLAMTPQPAIPFASAAMGLYAGDVNGDGKPDIVEQTDEVYVLLNDGSTLGLVLPTVTGGNRSASVGVGDVDHDGHADVALIGGIDVGTVNVAHATAQGTFDAEFSFYIGHQGTFVVAGDLDGDGVTDLIASTRDSMDVVILLARPNPTGAADERSCSLCGGPSQTGISDSCQALP